MAEIINQAPIHIIAVAASIGMGMALAACALFLVYIDKSRDT